MDHYSMYLPSYSIGEQVYQKVAEICRPYGSTAVVIGGKRAMAAAGEALTEALAGSGIQLLDFVWYGGEASYENVERLASLEMVQRAELLFAVGGGKATDTTKALANTIGKPVFTFPTIASNCSACTSVSIMYHEDGSFSNPFFFEKPPQHAFIQTAIIAAAPKRYLWAGIGDTYAKYFESTISSRGEALPHYTALGVTISRMCLEPLLQYGKQALKENEQGHTGTALEQAVLSVIVSTALVSILVTTERIIDYNTGLAHAIFYALTSFPQIEKNHLHGELVGFGVLLLLLCDGQQERFEQMYAFNRSIGLPTALSDVEITEEQLPQVIALAVKMKDIEHNPYPVTENMLTEAFAELEAYGRAGTVD